MIKFNYQTDFSLENERSYGNWITRFAADEKKTIGELSYVFCSDDFLLDINLRFLNHDTYTDIITFDYSQDELICGEIYISIDRVRENASLFNVSFDDELKRVMAHGVLHLIGYGDKTEDEKEMMRAKELEKMNMFHVKQ